MTITEEIRNSVDEYLKAENITVEFRQIQKAAAEQLAFSDVPSAYWAVEIGHAGTCEIQYQEGIGHFLEYLHGKKTLWEDAMEKKFIAKALDAASYVTRGDLYSEGQHWNRMRKERFKWDGNFGRITEPHPADIFYCLCSDYGVLDYHCYEDWADDYGYDRDSRRGEASYRKTLENALKLRAVIGETRIREIAELVQ